MVFRRDFVFVHSKMMGAMLLVVVFWALFLFGHRAIQGTQQQQQQPLLRVHPPLPATAAADATASQQWRRQLLVTLSIQGDNGIPSTAFPLGKCQGDCDSNDQCLGNLVCYQRNSGDPVPPGCSGTPVASKDYCYDPSDSRDVPTGSSLSWVGDNGVPSSVFPLGRCLGDCDSDDQCAGNLRCFQRNQGDPGPPGCTGMAVDATDYCYEVVQDSDGDLSLAGDDGKPDQAFPLGRCQGDCDSSKDCAENLVCFQRSTVEQPVPGCTGTPQGSKDYCIRPEDLPGPQPSPVFTPAAAPVLTPLDALKMVGDDGKPSRAFPLGQCQGDCDSSTDCAGNLICFQRSTVEQPVPGCTGTPQGSKDYCVRPEDLLGPPSPVFTPVAPPVLTPSEAFVLGKLTNRYEGLLLSQGLTARVIAHSGDVIDFTSKDAQAAHSSIPFHMNPDGAAIFELNDGAYVYVSNSETSDNMGGVYGMEFDRDGNVRDYRTLLAGTNRNCNGGRTPWNTWVSCEEVDGGQCYQVDPTGKKKSQQTVLGGATGGFLEAMAYDDRIGNSYPTFFVTEDVEDGVIRRFRPDASIPDGWNMLHGDGTIDYLEIVDATTFRWTSKLSDARKSAQKYFPNCEGIVHRKGILMFVSKILQQLFRLDLDRMTYTIETTKAKNLPGGGNFGDGPDHLLLDSDGTLYFTEDGGKSPGVFVYEGSKYLALLEAVESRYHGDETTGIAFSPDRKFLFFCIQDYGILFQVSRIDERPFDGRRVLAWKVDLGSV